MKQRVEDEDFDNLDYNDFPKSILKYDSCQFRNCTFSKKHLTGISFVECSFLDCDFSLATFGDTSFREVKFSNCKMIGLHFEHCNPFMLSMSFFRCELDLSSFYQAALSHTSFASSSLVEVDFTEANLSKATFDNCDLNKATFDKTNLERADFSAASNYVLDPAKNKVTKAIFSKNGLEGLLQAYQIEIV